MYILKGPFLSFTGTLQVTVQSSIISKVVIGPLVASEVVFNVTSLSWSRATVLDALNLMVFRVFTTLFSFMVESIFVIFSPAGSFSNLLRVSKCLDTLTFKRQVCSEMFCLKRTCSESSVRRTGFSFY